MTDDPKKRTGPSKKHQDASEELRIHMQIRNDVNRLSEMVSRQEQTVVHAREAVTRQEQTTSSARELIDRINDNLKRQGEKFMTRVEDAGVPSTPPPPPETKPERPSTRPTESFAAFNARTFERIVRTRWDEAKNSEDAKGKVRELLRRGIDSTEAFQKDAKLLALAEEIGA